MAVYVDTSAWIALHEPRDKNHARAKKALQGLGNRAEILLTGWHTLIELADGLARHYDQARASREVERLLRSPRLRVEPSEPYLEAARELFAGRRDWNVDFSDCLTLALVSSRGIRTVFTYDSDFAKPGFLLEG